MYPRSQNSIQLGSFLMTPDEIDQRQSEFEREKWRGEVRLREREGELKEREQRNKEEELRLKSREYERSRWTNPLVLAVFAAAIAAAGNAFVAWFTAHEQRIADLRKADLAREADANKSEADRILEVIKVNSDPDKAATNLKFLVEAGLISNQRIKDPLQAYLSRRKPGEGAALPSPTQLGPGARLPDLPDLPPLPSLPNTKGAP